MDSLRYAESITHFFRSPRWTTNALVCALCIVSGNIIPVVGMMVLMGWCTTVFHGSRLVNGVPVPWWNERPQDWPDFDLRAIVLYLKRSCWPFLVGLVSGLALLPCLLVAGVPLGLGVAMESEAGIVAGVIVSGLLVLVLFVAWGMLSVPLMLRAVVLQDFAAAFHFGWVRDFVRRMWLELFVAWLFNMAVGFGAYFVGLLACFVGIFFTFGLVFYSHAHICRQLLDLYHARGGEALEPSPELVDPLTLQLQALPPGVPATVPPPLRTDQTRPSAP